jgi:signal transduction histidine kinase
MSILSGNSDILHRMIHFERLVADLSAGFINVSTEAFDHAILQALRHIVESLGVDRSTLTQYFPETREFISTHCWVIDGLPPVPRMVMQPHWPWGEIRMRRGEMVVFSRLDDLPPEAAVDKAAFRSIGLKSHVSIPLRIDSDLVGLLSFGTLRVEQVWPVELLERVQVIGEIFASVLARKRAQAEIEHLLGFERLLSEISASFVNLAPRSIDPVIKRTLQQIGEFLSVDRAALWELSNHADGFRITDVWSAAAAEPPPAVVRQAELPWVFAQLYANHCVRFTTLDDLPVEAQADRQYFVELATQSHLSIPLAVGGTLIGALSLGTVTLERQWPDALVSRIRLLGEVLANALRRQQADWWVRAAQSEAAYYQERLAHLIRVHTVGEMSAAIAHEVNQPLMAIKNYALAALRRLRDDAAPREKQVELLDKIILQATRAGDVVQHLRSLVQKHEVEMRKLDLNHLIADTLKLVEMDGRLRDVRLERRLAADLPPVVADAIQIQQVILNLVRNAMEALEAHPGSVDRRVSIETTRTGPQDIEVRVKDRGPGLGPDEAEQIFEPFYSTKTSGLGIGLSICRKMVESHGGQLWASPNPAGGAVFHFTLRAAPLGD